MIRKEWADQIKESKKAMDCENDDCLKCEFYFPCGMCKMLTDDFLQLYL